MRFGSWAARTVLPFAVFLVPSAALAQGAQTGTQPKPQTSPARSGQGTGAGASGQIGQPGSLPAAASSPTNASTPAGAQLPPPPTINDAMLTPVAPAKTNVSTWEDVMKYVKARSTDLKIAYAEVTRAEGQWRIALAGALPTINGTGAVRKDLLTRTTTSTVAVNPANGQPITSTQTLPNTDWIATASLTASQPLFAPRAWYGIKTADINESVAKLSLDETKREITVRVALAVISVVTSERVAELNRIGLRAALERLDLTTRKKALGAATGLDVIRAQQDAESARATLVSGDESLRQARESLGLALGVPEPIGVSADINLDGLEKSTGSVCKAASSAEDRSDVATARGRKVLADREVGDVWWQFAPTVFAQTTLATTSLDNGVSPVTTWNIQAVLNVPLWEGGARYGLLKNAHVDVDEAENRLIALRRSVDIELAQTRRAVDVAEESRKVAASERQLAADADRLTRAGYLEGQGTSLELVVAAQALRQAEVNLALREFDLVRARIQALLSAANCPF